MLAGRANKAPKPVLSSSTWASYVSLWSDNTAYCRSTSPSGRGYLTPGDKLRDADADVDHELHVLGCRLTYLGPTVTNAEAWFNVAVRPQKP